MANWIDEMMRAEMRKDMLRAADHRRLGAQVRRAGRPARFYSPALAGLGRRLERWGCGLQRRYGALAEGGLAAQVGDHATRL